MKRNITEKLLKWKNSLSPKPLLLRGARQIGKSYSITDFGIHYFEGNLHIINLERNPELHRIFEQNLDAHRILSELELFLNKKIVAKRDLLFFDEIQECPKAIMALRYFYEQIPDLHLIAAGSLLEFALQDISFPVGRLQILSMYPMTFEEFLIANDKDLLAEKVKDCQSVFSENTLQIINEQLYKYFMVGGMPECVKTFVQTGSFIAVNAIQSDLLATFRQDFSKYATYSDKSCLNSVLSSVARKVGEQIKYSHLAEGFSNPTLKKAFQLLEAARLFSRVRNTSPEGLPLGAGASEKKFKAVFLDIGLLANLNGFNTQNLIPKQKMLAAFRGKMAEQFVGQELLTRSQNEVYYWHSDKRNSQAEIDYLIENEGEIIPIEVKSGKAGTLKSLHLLLKKFPNIKTGYVFTENHYGEIPEQKLKFLPLFCVGNAF